MNSVHEEDQKNHEAAGIPESGLPVNEDMPGKFMVFRRTLLKILVIA